jgi:hypothetical protein
MKTRISLATTTCQKMMAGRFRTVCATRLLPLLLFLLLPAAVQAQYCYTTNNGTITITCYTGPGGAVNIPNSINDLPVTSIGSNAFYDCTNLTSVTMGTNVTSIGVRAFCECTSLTSVTIPNSVTSIGDDAFGICTSLTKVTIPASVTNIGDGPFLSCFSLTAITVDTNNPAYSSVAGVLFNKSQTVLIQYPAGKAGSSYTIPNSVTNIGDDAFVGCSLTSVTMGTNVTSIGDWAFWGCSSLTSVTMGTNVTSIGDSAFAFCTSLTSVSIPNSVTNIGEGTFYYCFSLTSVTIGNDVTSIGDYEFYYCFRLTSVTIGNGVTSIGSNAFAGCSSLTSVYFAGNAPSADSSVFSGDNNATVYYLPGTTGWGSTFDGLPAVLWNPQAQNLGVQSNQFGFAITGPSNLVIVVEACTNLVNAVWVPVATNTLTGGSSYFSDPDWTNYPCRFYRFRPP